MYTMKACGLLRSTLLKLLLMNEFNAPNCEPLTLLINAMPDSAVLGITPAEASPKFNKVPASISVTFVSGSPGASVYQYLA